MALSRTSIAALAVTTGFAAFLAAGCGGSSTKAGGSVHRALTLILAAPDGPTADQAYLQNQVRIRTGGRIRIKLDNLTYSSVDPDNEAKLVRALESGKVSFAWLPARAWERASSVRVFRALQAPFLIDGYPLLARIANGPIAASMLATLGKNGIVGLGLLPNELRRPLGRVPLDSAASFRGARIRVVTSPTSVRDLRALGAVPLTNFTADSTEVALRHGTLDGVESEVRSIENNYYEDSAPYLPTNLTLFAKMQTIVMRRDEFERLDPADRAALRAAVAATVRHTDPASEERVEVRRLCQQGLKLVTATASELGSLHAGSAPVYAYLERDPATRAAIEAITRLKRTLSRTPPLIGPCPAAGPAPVKGVAGAFPNGTFETVVTLADFKRYQQRQNIPLPSTMYLSFENGVFKSWERPAIASQAPGGGTYVVKGTRITLHTNYPVHGVIDVLTWSYYRGTLVFKNVSVFDSESRLIYSAHPWRQISN